MPRVSVIVVNYNGKGIITGCLKALEAQSFKGFEALIIDNGSSDDSLNEIRDFLKETAIAPSVKLIPINKNLGFAGGNLEGFRSAKGEYIALLNTDTEPGEKWLEDLVVAMDNDSGAGICASKLVVYGTDIIDSAGDGFSTFLKGLKRGEGEKIFSYNQKGYIFGACAAAALYRRRMIEEVGFLDEDFFLIHEDTDLNFRAHLYGWKVLYVPEAIVYHKVRSTIGSMSDTAIYYTLRNTEFVRIKNIPFAVFQRCLVEFFMKTILEFIYFALKHRKLKLYFRAKIDALKMLPKMLEKRKIIMKNRRADNRYLLSLMTPAWKMDFLKAKIDKFLNS